MKRFYLLIVALLCVLPFAQAQGVATVKLSVESEANAELSALAAPLSKVNKGEKIKINNKEYELLSGRKGKLAVSVERSEDGVYKAGYPADITYSEAKSSPHMRLLPAQLYKEGGYNPIYMPLRAELSGEGGLVMKPLCGVLHLRVSGTAPLNCIRFEDNAGNYLAGYFNVDSESMVLRRRKATAAGIYSVVIECSNGGKGVQLDAAGKDFYVVLPVDTYEKGMKITFTDRNHHTMEYNTDAFEIKRGKVTSIAPIAYQHPKDQIFSEKFDNMVYGGDFMGGKNYKGFIPAASLSADGRKLEGTERATSLVLYNIAGMDYMSSAWKMRPVDEGLVSYEYLNNRNLLEYPALLRVQEYLGYIGVGVKDYNRGVFTTPNFNEIQGVSDIEISFKFSAEPRPTTDYLVRVLNAGVVKEYWIDDIRHTLTEKNYPYTQSESENILLVPRALGVGAAYKPEEKKPWYNVRLVVSGATAKTALSVLAQDMGQKERNGYYIDDIEVKLLRSVARKDILRVMNYNIQNGMWSVQAQNYDGFVEYMKQEDVDIAIFCESASNYRTGTKIRFKNNERYLPYKYQDYENGKADHLEPTGWIELAARYGHQYVAVGAHQDNFPVVVTSKYPIVKSVRLGGENVSHGGIHAQVKVDGELINIVGFHTWPQAWAFGVRGSEARNKSKSEYGGHWTRYEEVKSFVERSVLNPEYADQKHWIITGDMNSYSPLDDYHYDMGYSNPRYACIRYILENVPQVKDLMKHYYSPDKRDVLVFTTMSKRRIDFMFGSEKFVSTLVRAESPMAGFTKGVRDKETRFIKNNGSDHLPLICDFKWR